MGHAAVERIALMHDFKSYDLPKPNRPQNPWSCPALLASLDCKPARSKVIIMSKKNPAAPANYQRMFVSTIYQAVAAVLLCFSMMASPLLAQQQKLILVVGAGGTQEYAEMFNQWANRWESAAAQAKMPCVRIGKPNQLGTSTFPSSDVPNLGSDVDPSQAQSTEIRLSATTSDRQKLEDTLLQISRETNASQAVDSPNAESKNEPLAELWVVLIGHGTYDGQNAKFNLQGPDVSSKELGKWLDEIGIGIIVVNSASASGPFINDLSQQKRIVVTATQSGAQYNFARFGDFLSQSIADERIDLDKDNQTSLLEAVISASGMTQEFYALDKRLATEMAVIDDNGDGLGTPLDWFQGIRAAKSAKGGAVDGLSANQVFFVRRGIEGKLDDESRSRRDGLERQLEALRSKKNDMDLEIYYQRIETIMIQLAEIYSDD